MPVVVVGSRILGILLDKVDKIVQEQTQYDTEGCGCYDKRPVS